MKNKCKICGTRVKLLIHDIYDDRYGAPGSYNIYRCKKCGFGFTNPKIRNTKVGEFYDRYYPLSAVTPEQVKKSAVIKSALFTWLTGTDNVSHLYIKPHTSVLDIGSAGGQSLIEISKLKGKAFGIEPNPNAKIIAKKLNLDVYTGLITDNPFPDKKFDFVTASQVLEHDCSPKTFLKAVRKKIKKNGTVILSVPNFDSVYRKIFGKKWIHWHVPYHCNFFTKKSFEILANEMGFKIIKSKTITPNLWTVLQIRRLFTSPHKNEKNAIWNLQHHWSNKRSIKSKIITATLKLTLNLAIIMIAPIDRFVDLIGQGDSFVVFLEKDEK